MLKISAECSYANALETSDFVELFWGEVLVIFGNLLVYLFEFFGSALPLRNRVIIALTLKLFAQLFKAFYNFLFTAGTRRG